MSHPSSARDSPLAEAPRRVKVGVGEFAVATDDAVLTTSGLGSCVAVAVYDADADVRGLLHAMLPSDGGTTTPAPRPAKYVDTGVETLLDAVHEAGGQPGRLDARIVGGAEMLDLTEAVGPRNVEGANEALAAAGVPVVARDVGSDVGRTVRYLPDGGLAVRAADGFERTL